MFLKILIKKKDLLLLLLLPSRGQNPLSYYILYNESKHNISFALVIGKPDKIEERKGNEIHFERDFG
jgi:hypothetical protein